LFKNTFNATMLLIFIVANGLYFINFGLRHEIDFWISYAFVIFSYITLWGSAFRQNDSSSEYHFALTRIIVNVTYVILAFSCAVAVCYFDLEGLFFWLPQTVVALLFIILMLYLSDIDDRHADLEQEVTVRSSFISNSLDNMDEIRQIANDSEVLRRIDLIIDMLVSSQPSPSNVELRSESDFIDYLERLRRRVKMNSIDECLSILSHMERVLDLRNKQISKMR